MNGEDTPIKQHGEPKSRRVIHAMHCKSDKRICRGVDYCVCQCELCIAAWQTPMKEAELRTESEPSDG